MKIQIIGGIVYYKENIARWCQQTFCFQKFVDNAPQCFAFTPQESLLELKQTFSPKIWIFTEGEGDRIESRLLS